MAALERAFAFAKMDHVAVLVAQHLKLDVPRFLNQLFHVDVRAAEGLLGFRSRGVKGGNQLALRAHHAHAASASSLGRLDHQGKPDLSHNFFRSGFIRHYAITSGDDCQARGAHLYARAVFFSHHPDHRR